MSGATLGDLLSLADQRLQEVERAPGPAAIQLVPQFRSLVGALVRYTGHLVPAANVAGIVSVAEPRIWGRTAFDVREALWLGRDALARAPYAEPNPSPDDVPALTHLADATTALACGHDLLSTHHRGNAVDSSTERSGWAKVVAAYPVRRALIDEVATWSQRLASWSQWLRQAATDPHTRDALTAASHYLHLAGQAVSVARRAEPVPQDDRDLLYGVAAAEPPHRSAVRASETITDLCAGITQTAERLRLLAFTMPEHADWSPVITAKAWHYTATAAAVSLACGRTALHALAIRLGQLGEPGTALRIRTVTDQIVMAQDAWIATAGQWTAVTTESRHAKSPAITEASDLVLRTGRLAFRNADWSPATGRRAVPREPEELARTRSDALDVLSAIHQATDATVRLAVGHISAIATAASAGRLYVPTRTLENVHASSLRYSPIPPGRVEELLEKYRAAGDCSDRAARTLASLVLDLHAPSRVLALARIAVQAEEAPAEAEYHAAALPEGGSRTQFATDMLRSLGNTDPGMFLRAAAIDRAARDLLSDARRAADVAANDQPKTRSRPAFPAGATMQRRSTGRQPGNRPSRGR